MKLGVISDIHANLPALKAVLSALEEEDVDSIVCLGDIVGVLGSSAEVVELVRNSCEYTVYGNHDTRVFPERDWMCVRDYEFVEYEHTLQSLSDNQLDWLTSLPGMLTVYDNVTLAHCRPDPENPDGGKTGDSGIKPRKFVSVGGEYLDGGILLFGHTHYQKSLSLDKFDGQSGLMVNPGSVGYPYGYEERTDGGKTFHVGKASYAIVDTEQKTAELRSVEYDSTDVFTHLEKHDLEDARSEDSTTRGRH